MEDNGNGSAEGAGEAGSAGVRVVALSLPEDEGEGLGFRLTRTLWDPYPWVREVVQGSRASAAGLKVGDCILQADGQDLLGMPVGQVAGLIRGDGAGGSVTLLAWNCGVDPSDDPELLWSCGGGARGERARRALTGVVRALACAVCAATATKPLACARSHLYCEPCWLRLQRCALCREALPPKESPYARNLVAEQVFEAIASEYEIKETIRKPLTSTSSNASPNLSPSLIRRGHYQISMMNKKKAVQFKNKFGQHFASDPNIHRSTSADTRPKPSNLVGRPGASNTESSGNECSCITKIGKTVQTDAKNNVSEEKLFNMSEQCCKNAAQTKILAQIRPTCSLADLQNALQSFHCSLSRSLNNVNNTEACPNRNNHISCENLRAHSCCNVTVLPSLSPEWRDTVKRRVREFEQQRKADLDIKRDELKARPPAAINYNYVDGDLTCAQCARRFTNKEPTQTPVMFLSVPPICVIPCDQTTPKNNASVC